MITNGYLGLAELQETLGATTTTSVASYELAIESASRWIDDRCSDPTRGRVRHFWRETTATPRLFHATGRHVVHTGDFDTTTGVTVETDVTGTGVFTPFTAWQAEPVVRVNGFPYACITTTSHTTAFPLGLNPRVKVTAQWGWAAIPVPVRQACKILAVAYMLGKDVISNEDGYSVGTMGPTNPISLAEHLLTPYMLNPPAAEPARR